MHVNILSTYSDTLTETDFMSLLSLHLPEQPSRKPCPQIRLCVCACVPFFLLPVRHHWSSMLHRALYCPTYGLCPSALSRKQGQTGSLRMEPFGFDAVQLPFMFRIGKLGCWWGSTKGVTGPNAGSLYVCVGFLFWVSDGCWNSRLLVTMAHWQTHFLWKSRQHAAPCFSFAFHLLI